MLLRLEQKSVKWLMDPVFNLYKVGELVLNTFHGTLATVNAGLQLPEHHRFAEFEKDFACFQDTLPSLVESYER